ncbi:MAG: exodeoxyribonuclease V subunit beta [Syntrophales bacterium]
MKQFDPINSPLDGRNLIEAAAGTGKTYAVTCLFVRLVVEKGLPVKEILVVTFTVAATEELKDRIRRKLKDALDSFARGQCDEAFLKGLLDKHLHAFDRQIAVERLTAAIRDFDEAAIFTIHGFCQRMLYENAFESGALFDVEIVTNQEDLRKEIVEDFWRIHFYDSIPELVEYAMNRGFSPGYFLRLLDNNAMNPDVRIVPEADPPDIGTIADSLAIFEEKVNRLREIWTTSREEITEKLKSQSLKANVYGGKIAAMMEAMQGFLACDKQHPTLFGVFEKFTQERISASTKKGAAPPRHEFFAVCGDVVAAARAVIDLMERHLLFLKTEMILTARREITARKGLRNIMFYDDLLLKMRGALNGAGGQALATAIRRKYKSAIIDEFQDTDTIQYAIFHAIFGEEGGDLFLIGDPKQTIFDFRGADVFAYMKAASVVDTKYALSENWRSEPGLVKAINTLFSHGHKAFVYEGISFQPAEAASGKEHRYLKVKGKNEAPLHLWIVQGDGASQAAKGLAKGRARSLICRSVAAEIARLLELGRAGQALIGIEPLHEGDIAVLVRTNREAVFVQDALSEMGIPSVLHIKENIFDSREALEMERVLKGIANPDHEGLVRGALTTDIIGSDGTDLDRFKKDENEWKIWLERFWDYHEIWHAQGFIKMFRQVVTVEHLKERLLRYPDGKRRLTNVLHLAELLEGESVGKKLGPMALVRWFIKQRDSRTLRSNEDQIRLESDEKAVKVVTIHKSKGLEYPVVFCPFVWGGSNVEGDILRFHDEQNEWRLTCDVGSANRQRSEENARNELLAENVRLLYVALTRARHRCYLIWGKFNDAGTSAPAYLFHRGTSDSSDNVIDNTDERYCKLTESELFRDIGDIVTKSGGTIDAYEMPIEAVSKHCAPYDIGDRPECRHFSRTIDRSWKIASFSYLASERTHVEDLPDRDFSPHMDVPPEDVTGPHASDIFAFPKGARAGSFLHEIMEHMDYTQKDISAARILVSQKLPEYGFDSKWVDAVTSMLENVVNLPLDREDAGLKLAAVTGHDRINEVEFYFPLKHISPEALRSIYNIAQSRCKTDCVLAIPEIMDKLRFSPARGYMKGYMDMIFRYADRFYLVDWKSNFLGGQVTDYDTAALSRLMTESFYFLQYHIYTVALNKFLQLRMSDYRYDKHFGGVYYLFLRGMDPAWGREYGVYYDRPEEGLIQSLTETLIGEA